MDLSRRNRFLWQDVILYREMYGCKILMRGVLARFFVQLLFVQQKRVKRIVYRHGVGYV